MGGRCERADVSEPSDQAGRTQLGPQPARRIIVVALAAEDEQPVGERRDLACEDFRGGAVFFVEDTRLDSALEVEDAERRKAPDRRAHHGVDAAHLMDVYRNAHPRA